MVGQVPVQFDQLHQPLAVQPLGHGVRRFAAVGHVDESVVGRGLVEEIPERSSVVVVVFDALKNTPDQRRSLRHGQPTLTSLFSLLERPYKPFSRRFFLSSRPSRFRSFYYAVR